MESLDNSIDNKRIEKSLSLLTRKFVELLLASKNGILDLKVVSTQAFHSFCANWLLNHAFALFFMVYFCLWINFIPSLLIHFDFYYALFDKLKFQYGHTKFGRYEIAPFCVMFDVISNIGAIFAFELLLRFHIFRSLFDQ